MVKVGKWIAKHRILMLIIGFLLIIPSVIGMAATKVNYDLLSYLPEHLETVKGQDILVDEYGMGAFSMVVVENMEMKDVQKLEEKFEQVNHVKEVLFAYAAIVVMRICLTNTSRRFIIRFIHDKDGHKLISFADYFKIRAYAEEI